MASNKPGKDRVRALRYALAGSVPELQRTAERIVERCNKADRVGVRAARLGISRRSYENLRRDFPDVFT